ncbi:unnamed protein product [Closterium sp. NIES-53]
MARRYRRDMEEEEEEEEGDQREGAVQASWRGEEGGGRERKSGGAGSKPQGGRGSSSETDAVQHEQSTPEFTNSGWVRFELS